MMPSNVDEGVTISVTAETDAGKRRHMEDYLSVRLAPNEALKRIPELSEQAFVGVFDGHGGKEAALYARERLWDLIQEQSKFRTTDRQKVVEAIQDAYWALHREMEPLRRTWKPNKLGDMSTAGTTACTVIFRQDHFYVANVGDSSAVLATVNQRAGEDGQPPLLAKMLSKDHKPDDPSETQRVESLGGQVKVSRKGVPRVVWERKKPSDGDTPPSIDFIPFLSVSRSLGDFWSWSERTRQFVVSPQPDVHIHSLDTAHQRFLVLASDGLWNVMSPQDVVDFVWEHEAGDQGGELPHKDRDVVRALIDEALYRWRKKGMFADNISIVIAFLSQDSDSSQMGEPAGESAAERENSPPGPAVVQKLLSEGELIEDHTVISLRCRLTDKLSAEREEAAEEKSAVKRLREEEGEGEGGTGQLECPPQKRGRQERDSGCESDSGSPVGGAGASLEPGIPQTSVAPPPPSCDGAPAVV